MAHPASLEHILKDAGLCFSSSVYKKKCFFFSFELAKQNWAIFPSVLTGMGLVFIIFTNDSRMLRDNIILILWHLVVSNMMGTVQQNRYSTLTDQGDH